MKTFLILSGMILTLALVTQPKSSHASPPGPKPVTVMNITLYDVAFDSDGVVRYTENKSGKKQYLVKGTVTDPTLGVLTYTIVVNINSVGKKGLGLINCIANGSMYDAGGNLVYCGHNKANSSLAYDNGAGTLDIDMVWNTPPCD